MEAIYAALLRVGLVLLDMVWNRGAARGFDLWARTLDSNREKYRFSLIVSNVACTPKTKMTT